jgi:hypothetical protein
MRKDNTNLIIAAIVGIGWFLPIFIRNNGDGVSQSQILYEAAFGVNGSANSITDFLIDFFGFLLPSASIIAVVVLYCLYYFNEQDKFRKWANIVFFASIILILAFMILIAGLNSGDVKIGIFFYIYHLIYFVFGFMIYREKKMTSTEKSQPTSFSSTPKTEAENKDNEIQQWLKNNPTKGLNEYYQEIKKDNNKHDDNAQASNVNYQSDKLTPTSNTTNSKPNTTKNEAKWIETLMTIGGIILIIGYIAYKGKTYIIPGHKYPIYQTCQSARDLTLDFMQIKDDKTYLSLTHRNSNSKKTYFWLYPPGNSKSFYLVDTKKGRKMPLLNIVDSEIYPEKNYIEAKEDKTFQLVFDKIDFSEFHLIEGEIDEKDGKAYVFMNIKVKNW